MKNFVATAFTREIISIKDAWMYTDLSQDDTMRLSDEGLMLIGKCENLDKMHRKFYSCTNLADMVIQYTKKCKLYGVYINPCKFALYVQDLNLLQYLRRCILDIYDWN